MSCSVGCLRFIDSFQYLSASLDDLVKNLYESENKYKHFHNMKKKNRMINQNYYAKKVTILMNGLMTIVNQITLDCQKENVYSTLSGKAISEDKYEHACNVYGKLKCKTFRDYHDIYIYIHLKCDVSLLTDVFEQFRDMCMKNYKLDPTNYVILPGVAWDAALEKNWY